MNHCFKSIILFLFLLANTFFISAQKVVVDMSEDGAWSNNSEPGAVYYNGKTYFAWLNAKKNLIVSSYDHSSGEIKEQTLSTGYNDDFSSPAIAIRATGQILVFASNNQKEDGFYCWRSNAPEDISSWSGSQKQTGYGISSTTPLFMDNDLVVFWRSKNNVGYSLYKDIKGKDTALPAPAKRAGFIGTDIGNNYAHREEIPYMKVCQSADGTIHMVVTHLGTGKTYNNSTVHYIKIAKDATGSALTFRKADNSPLSGMNVTESKGCVLDTIASGSDMNKVWAYDIALNENNQPVVLYDKFIASGDKTTSAHTYYSATWNGHEWVSSQITVAGDGLSLTQYKSVQGYTFDANSFQSGGICFDALNPSKVYLSKKNDSGFFSLYSYITSDNGVNWTQQEILSNDGANQDNIRPMTVMHAPQDYPVNVYWMRGTYENPTLFNTSVACAGESTAATGIFLDKNSYEGAMNTVLDIKVKVAPVFASDKEYLFESSNPDIIEVQSNNQIFCKAVGKATITVRLKNNPLLFATSEVNVLGQSVYSLFADRVIADLRADKMPETESLDLTVTQILSQLNADGSFPDVDYSSTERTNWEPLKHLDRLLSMGLAYTNSKSSFYESESLKSKMDQMLSYWQTVQPRSNNWYQNEIAEPQRMGQYLILIQNSGKQPVPVALFDKSVERLRTKGGNPGAQAGANRVDVALHWMYRACLISDPDLLKEAMDYIYSTVVYTTGAEGIQPDHSFTQHGRQLHIGAYGDVYIGGTTKACSYAAGTTYAISGDQLDILVRLVKDTYLSTFRGEYISYNVIGRASTRPNATKKTGQTAVMSRMKMLDPANAASYDQAIARISGLERPEFMVKAESNHFYRSDYTLHKRPQFTVDLRLVSTRTARNEYLKDNGEGIKQYFLSDGSTGIFVNGDEYSNIFPVWNYAKVPGVTCPEFTEIPQASTYIKMGQSSFVGGVTDSVYSVSAYKYSDFDTQFGVNTSANKAWFFFDKEVVCLGNGIESASEYQVNTTLNQCLLKSDVTVSENGVSKTLTKGDYNFDHSIDWAYHNGVGYFFPQKANVDLSLKEQTGKWTDINTNYSDELVKQDVFSLSVNHGIKPDNHSYAYVLLPGMNSISDMHTYNSDNIEIIANTDSIQAVYHKGLNIYGIVFYKAGGFNKHGLIVEADAGCIVMVQDADKESVLVSVSDPTNGSVPVNLGVETSQIKGRRLVTYKNSNLNEGRTLKFVVSQNTPVSSGRDQLLNRSKWTITTSINGPKDADALVGGDNPDNIIDNDTKSAFLFVKPGKSFSGINAPADYVPAFEIDRNGNEDFEYFIYRHRDYNNTLEYLRAQNISLYGKNIDSDEYQPIIENKSILTSVSENKVELAGKQNCRYLKLTINEWDKASGSTIQVADFNIGNKVILDIPETGEPTSTDKIEADKSMQNILLIPNQVRKGEKISIRSDLDNQSMIYDVYDLSGLRRKSGTGTQLDTNDLHSGIYLIQVKDISQGITGVAKFIVR